MAINTRFTNELLKPRTLNKVLSSTSTDLIILIAVTLGMSEKSNYSRGTTKHLFSGKRPSRKKVLFR